jgi:hypothetical protein
MLLTKPLVSQYIDAEEAQQAAPEDKWKEVHLLHAFLEQKYKY